MKLLIALLLCAVNCFALDREAFTFTTYQLEARIEPEQQRLGVRGKITLRNDSTSAQKNAVLQISSTLSWRSIQAEGKPLQFVTQPYQSDIDHTGALSEAIVSLPHEIPPKGTVELEIGYEGTIPLDATRLTWIGTPKDIATHTDWDRISESFTAVRGAGNVVWYPVAMESASLSEGNSVFETLGRWRSRSRQSDLRLGLCEIHLAQLQARLLITNGVGSGGGGYGGGGFDGAFSTVRKFASCGDFQFHSLETSEPMFALSNYSGLSGDTAIIYHNSDHKSQAQNYELMAELAKPLVAEWFGAPKKKIEILELPDVNDAPYESSTMLLTPLAARISTSAQLSLVHELTHAAFFSPRAWIYEGLAYFAQALFQSQQNGRPAALDFLGTRRDVLAEVERSAATTGGKPLISTTDEILYGAKAPYVWWMLRDMVGDDALKKALAAYRPEQDKDPAYMQHLIEAEAKRDLGWFFDDWVYHDRGLPDFRVASVYSRANEEGRYLVTITIENTGQAGAEVPVTLRTEKSETMKRLEVRAKSSATIRMEALSQPLEVVVNDGSVPETDMENNAYKIGGK